MPWTKDSEEAFPPRHPREPGGLRRDILDEIADHLACAAEREAERGGENDTEESAWGRVLERFGDPDAIARRLWWDQMRETVMREWIQTGVMVVVAVAVVAFMTLVVRQMNTANQAVLEALKGNATAVNPLVTLQVKVTRGTGDGPPAEGLEVRAHGNAFGGEATHMRRAADASGIATFGPMQPGQYEVYVTDPKADLQLQGKQVTLFAGQAPETLHITTPDVAPRALDLELSSPMPAGEGRVLHAAFVTRLQGDGGNWEGRSVGIVEDGAVFKSDGLKFLDQSPRIDPTDDRFWSSLSQYDGPLMISGDPTEIYLSLRTRAEHGARPTPRNAPSQNLSTTLRGDAIVPAQDGSGYRLELPPDFQRQIADWRTQDHAAARGIELDEQLWRAVRAAYPEHLVDVADRVAESESGWLSGGRLYHPEGPFDPGDTFAASGMRVFEPGNGNPGIDFRQIGIMRMPDTKAIAANTGSRVLLAICAINSQLREFENALQVWPVLNDVFTPEWPILTPEPPSEVLALELGTSPVFEIGNDDIIQAFNVGPWLLLDVTAAFSNESGAVWPQGLMLRWSREEFGFKNGIEMVAAGAKQADNKKLRPMWLVLTPMADGMGAS